MTLQELNNQPTYWKVLDSTYRPEEYTKAMIGKIYQQKSDIINTSNGRIIELWDEGVWFYFNHSDLQRMTPVKFNGEFIGIGDDIKGIGDTLWRKVYGYSWYDGEWLLQASFILTLDDSCEDFAKEDISGHRPLFKSKDKISEAMKVLEDAKVNFTVEDGKIIIK